MVVRGDENFGDHRDHGDAPIPSKLPPVIGIRRPQKMMGASREVKTCSDLKMPGKNGGKMICLIQYVLFLFLVEYVFFFQEGRLI